MPRQSRVRLAALPGRFADRADSAQFADWLAVAEPDGIVLTEGASGRARQRLARQAERSLPILDPRTAGTSTDLALGDRPVAVAPTAEDVATALGAERPDATGPRIVVTAGIELTIDTTALSTTVHGREALATDVPEPGAVVLSIELPDGYRREFHDITLVGLGDPEDEADSSLVTVEIRADGTVLTESHAPSRLGLQALSGIGPKRAETLRHAGYDSREAIASASRAELRDLTGFGSGVVDTVLDSAEAIVEGRVVRRSRSPVPASDPVFVDIETDGLHPTVTWLVGVLDGGPEGTYRSFRALDPEDPGEAIEGFVNWYASEAAGRTLVAYNGRRFDFPTLRDHIQAYRPELLVDYEGADRFDPYAWAVHEEHAVLPGLTNRLEDVAAALGFEGHDQGLSGAEVARRYRQWADGPSTTSEPDWDELDRYCEDDVRALATVYEALAEVGGTAGRTARSSRTETTQGTLGDW